MELSALFLSFSIYSFLGWVCETAYCSVLSKKFVNRGFLNGPFCPVYGFGALLLILLLHNVPKNPVLIFLAGIMITTALEYFTGYLLEAVFHAKWWDYSHYRFNYKGRICLLNSTLFGLLSVGLMLILKPMTETLVNGLLPLERFFAAATLAVYFSADLAVTVKSMYSLNLRLADLEKAAALLKEKLDVSEFYNALGLEVRLEKLHELRKTAAGQAVYKSVAGLKEQIGRLESDNRLLQRRILKAFPNIRSTRHPEILAVIKKEIQNGKILPR